MRIVELAFDPQPADIGALRTRLDEVRDRFVDAAARSATVRPTIVITPFGAASADVLATRLDELGIAVVSRPAVGGFAALATALQVTWSDDRGLEKAVAFEAAWRALYPVDRCACWELRSMRDYQRLCLAKPQLRRELEAERLGIVTPRFCFRAKLQAFHAPDPDRVALESAWLDRAIPGRDLL